MKQYESGVGRPSDSIVHAKVSTVVAHVHNAPVKIEPTSTTGRQLKTTPEATVDITHALHPKADRSPVMFKKVYQTPKQDPEQLEHSEANSRALEALAENAPRNLVELPETAPGGTEKMSEMAHRRPEKLHETAPRGTEQLQAISPQDADEPAEMSRNSEEVYDMPPHNPDELLDVASNDPEDVLEADSSEPEKLGAKFFKNMPSI